MANHQRGSSPVDLRGQFQITIKKIRYLKVRNIPKPLKEKNKEKEAMPFLYWSCVQPSVQRIPLRRGRKIGCADFWAPEALLRRQTSLFFLFLMSTGMK